MTVTISNHVSQFSIISNMFVNIPGNKSNICEREVTRSARENFILDYFSVEWEDLLNIDGLNVDNQSKNL